MFKHSLYVILDLINFNAIVMWHTLGAIIIKALIHEIQSAIKKRMVDVLLTNMM